MTIQINNPKMESDEIDLVELVKTLWNKKWWIVLSTFICTTLAGIYAFTAKEQWTSKAEVIPPRISDLGSYLNLRKEYARILGVEFDISAFSNGLFDRFERLAYSLDEREKFLVNSQVYKNLSEGKDDVAKRRLLNELAREGFSVVKPDPKKEPDIIGRRFSFSAETPDSAQSTLKNFISSINQSAFDLDLKDFLLLANEKIADLKFERIQIQKNLVIQSNVQLNNLNKAYETAKKAEIKEYSKVLLSDTYDKSEVIVTNDAKVSLSDSKLGDNSYLFMLGEKYLKAQIDVASEKGMVYPPRYYQLEEQLNILEPLLNKINSVKVNSFSYLSSPDYPVIKEKPKTILILLVGLVIGFIFSSIMVLSIGFLRKESNNSV